MSEMKFMEACLEGEALLEDIEEYIEEWHDSDSDEEIYEYLGMTMEEYLVFLEDDAMLKTIFYAREFNLPVTEFIQKNNEQMLAARASSPEEAAMVKDWLVKAGRLGNGE